MANKKYGIKTACPQCGCSSVTHLSKEEIQKRFPNVPNVELECGECMLMYETSMEEACPEWDDECRMEGKE
ncbi:MAG: hypothetical protein D3926_12235 [Desulfobacteraceae bacterium]|nr:MAG: hypothetical protein D3926_12235 [Desulfobacteraceae bacterium]